MTLLFIVIFLLLLGVVAYFHYIQSAFSAILSAIFSALAAVLAIGYYQEVATLGNAPLGSYGDAVAMVAIFAITYFVLRILFDRMVPGNVAIPVTIDRVIAVTAGLVAGVFCVGTAATAVQLLPFGPSIAYYSPYPLEDVQKTGQIEGLRQRAQLTQFNKLQVDSFDPAQRTNLLPPMDKWTIGLAKHVSDGGSMAGSANLAEQDPDFLDSAYGQRLGIEAGADIILPVGFGGKDDASVDGIYRITEPIPQVQGELEMFSESDGLADRYTPPGGKSLLVVRVDLTEDAGDIDNILRFAPAAVRFNANRKTYYAIGTLAGSRVLVRNKLDDYIRANAGSAVSLAFEVDDDVFATSEGMLVDDAQVVFKRYGRLPIGAATAGPYVPTDDDAVIRKPEVATNIQAAKQSAPAAPPADATNESDTEPTEPS